MPVTPFHGGIGLAFKGAAPRRFSFLLFCCTQVAIDLESGYHIVRGDWPIHRFFHTFLGAILVCLIAVFACRLVIRAVQRKLAERPDVRGRIQPAEISWRVAIGTAFIGCLGHVIPDAIMHYDVEPFAPFTTVNPFYEVVSVGALHGALVAIGVVGLGAILRNQRR
jgi:hypothetical protein